MIPKMIDVLDDNGNIISSDRAHTEREDNKKSTFNLYDSYKSIAITSKSVLNTDVYEFNERFSDIISEVIVKDNRYLLSPEQKKLIDRYFSTAPDSVGIDGLRRTEAEVFDLLSDEDLVQLDQYLGEV